MFYALRNIFMRWGWSTQSTEGMGDIGMGMPPTNQKAYWVCQWAAYPWGLSNQAGKSLKIGHMSSLMLYHRKSNCLFSPFPSSYCVTPSISFHLGFFVSFSAFFLLFHLKT